MNYCQISPSILPQSHGNYTVLRQYPIGAVKGSGCDQQNDAALWEKRRLGRERGPEGAGSERIKSGGEGKSPDSNQDTSKWLMIILTSCGIAGLSWAFGAILHGGTNNILKWAGITCSEIWPVQAFRTEAINTSGSCDELQVIPCSISSTPTYNTYQPTVLEGADKERVIRRMSQYSESLGSCLRWRWNRKNHPVKRSWRKWVLKKTIR